jgi:hypothetical protein
MTTRRKNPYRRIYPEAESIIFDGGMDNKYSRALIPDNESPDCANVVFFDDAVGTRDGAVKLNTAVAGANPFDGLYVRRDNTGAESMCAFIDGHMKVLNATTFVTVPSAQSVFTIGARVGTDMAENYMFIGNGVNGPYKWDGTNFTQHGVSAPTSTITVASGTTGSLITGGVYRWAYTYVNSALVEGNISPVPSTWVVTTAGNGLAANLTTIGTAAASGGVARRRLYRTLNGGATYFKVADISDNTTTSYTDQTADANLGAAAPTDNGLPPAYNAIFYHRNILFVNDPANPNYVWYSTIGQPYTFASTNFFKVGDRTSDLVKGFAAYDNHLIVFCEQSVWINYMADPATPSGWRQIPTNSPYGTRAPYCLLPFQNKVLFASQQERKFVGFGALSGLALDPASTLLTVSQAGSDLQSTRIEPDMFNVNEAYSANITGIVFKTRAYISLTYGTSATANNRIYCFDFSPNNLQKSQKNTWVPFTGLNAQQFCIYGGKLYYGSSDSTGFVYQMDGTGVYSDNGAAINSYYSTKEYPGYAADTNTHKDFRFANLMVDLAGAYPMTFGYRTDSDSGGFNTQDVMLNPGGSIWGTMVWGRDLWGGGAAQKEFRLPLNGARGKRIQYYFSNQNVAGQRFKAIRMNFAYNLKGAR